MNDVEPVEQIRAEFAAPAGLLQILIRGGQDPHIEIDDLARLRELGAAGAIVGRALYTGAIDLGEAVARMGRG